MAQKNPSQDLPEIPPQDFQPVPNGQLRVLGETPRDFIKRRAEQERVRREKASPDELLNWTHRQWHADNGTGTNKSKVYYWPKIAGVRRRTIVEKKQISDCWDNTADRADRTANQRKYSDVFDEWDICTEFDPSDDTPFDDSDSTPPFTGTDITAQASPPPARNTHDPPRPPPQVLSSAHKDQGLLSAHAFGVDNKEDKIPELDVLMYARYGFQVEAMVSDIHQGILTLPSDAFSLEKVAEVLMEKNAVSSSRTEAAVRLIATLLDRGLPIPDQYWDVKNNQLRNENHGYFHFLPLKLTSLASGTVLEGYTVYPTTSKYLRPWVLFFESPIGIAQCVREGWGPSLENVVCKACENGYRIHLFLVKNKQALPYLASPPLLFTRREREEGFTPSHFDFRAYQRIVEVLVKQPRFRAAVLRGGVLGRICSPYITLGELAEGPSPDAVRYGLRWKAEGRDVVFVEDYISEDEIHLLCGYFYVDNSRSSGRQGQFKSFSFFPTPDIWEKSGIHTAMWSNSAEQKFRSLIEGLNPQSDADSTRPIPVPFKTSSQWKSNIRLHHKQTKKFLGYVEAASAAFISSL